MRATASHQFAKQNPLGVESLMTHAAHAVSHADLCMELGQEQVEAGRLL